MKEWKLPSTDGINELRVVTWETTQTPRAVLQISHGMIEYMNRYQDFAEYLNEKGFVVVGNDHLGHGYTAKNPEDLGYFAAKGKSAVVVEDLHEVTKKVKEEYPGLPYFMLGHSMGSFMARRYLMTYGEELDGAVIMGTGSQPGAVLAFGNMACNVIKLFHGDRYRSKFLKKSAFGNYNKKIDTLRTPSDWLTKDDAAVDKYRKDPLCSFDFTVNGYSGLFDSISFIQKKKHIAQIPKNLPVLLVSGGKDPVGAYGAGPTKVYESYRAHGLEDVDLILYPEDRHEILNEKDKEQVYSDILNFLEKHI